jgi:DNA-binding XRE family transcriptional regulator
LQAVSASRPIEELRRAATELIISQLSQISVTQAAADLGITRQAIYAIKRGQFCPSMELIQRACEAWGLEFTFRGLRIGAGALTGKRDRSHQQTLQLDLFEAIRTQLQNQTALIETKKVGRAVELVLRFRITA